MEHCLSDSNRISHKNVVSGVRCQETSGDDDRLKIAPCDVINWGIPVTNGCNSRHSQVIQTSDNKMRTIVPLLGWLVGWSVDSDKTVLQ